MQALEKVLVQRTPELVDVLIQCEGFSTERARVERFVALAGNDLIESLEWQTDCFGPRKLAAPTTTRDVLSTMSASRIASTLGMSRAEVWLGLRTLVPRLLRLAHTSQRACPHVGNPSTRIRPPRRQRVPA